MAEKEPEQEFTGDDFKRLLRAGLKAAKKKGGELISRIGHEIDPDVRAEKYIQRKYRQLVDVAKIDPEVAKETIKRQIDKILGN